MLPSTILELGVPLIVTLFPLIEEVIPGGKPFIAALAVAPCIVKIIGLIACPRQVFCNKSPLVKVTVEEGFKVIDPLACEPSPPKEVTV